MNIARALLLVLLTSPTSAAAEEGLWAGIPLDTLPALELATPHLDLLRSAWQAALPNGFVKVSIHPSVEDAQAAFTTQVMTATTRELPALTLEGADEARGDHEQLLVARSKNVVILVRDRDARAAAAVSGLLDALVTDAPAGTEQEKVVDGTRVEWDSCGRRTETPL